MIKSIGGYEGCKMPHNADSNFIANHRLGCCLSHFFEDSKRSASAMMELSPWSSYSLSSSSSPSLPLSVGVASYEIWERAMRLRESPMFWLFGDCFCAYLSLPWANLPQVCSLQCLHRVGLGSKLFHRECLHRERLCRVRLILIISIQTVSYVQNESNSRDVKISLFRPRCVC